MECTEPRGTALKASPCAFLPCHLLAVVFSGFLRICYNLKTPLFTCKGAVSSCLAWCAPEPTAMEWSCFLPPSAFPHGWGCGCMCMAEREAERAAWKAARHSVSAEQQEPATSTSPSTVWMRQSKTPGQGETCAAEGEVGKKSINIQWRKRENTFWLQLWL